MCIGKRKLLFVFAGRGSSIGSVSAWHASGSESSIPMSGTFFRGDLVMKKMSTAILPLLLIQEEQLSVTGERMCTKYW